MSADSAATAAVPPKRRFAIGTGIVHRASPAVRRAILKLGRGIGRVAFALTVEGRENLPPKGEPVLVISNPFGWFDAFTLTLFLPFQPVFLVATESQRKWYVRFFMNLFDGIPIWRGQPDRAGEAGELDPPHRVENPHRAQRFASRRRHPAASPRRAR